jgi:hypothetical protein
MRSKFAKSAIMTKKIITKGSKQIYRQKHWKEVQNPKLEQFKLQFQQIWNQQKLFVLLTYMGFFTKKFVAIRILLANFEKI